MISSSLFFYNFELQATDGDYCENNSYSCCQITSFLLEPWLTIDLEKPEVVRQINLFTLPNKGIILTGIILRNNTVQ